MFQLLRRLRDQGRSFDLIILDRPSSHRPPLWRNAARGYKDTICTPSSSYVRVDCYSYSCSGGVSRDLFQKIIAGAALDAVDAQILRT